MFWTVCPHYPVYSRHQSLPAADSNTQRHSGYLRSQLLGKLHVNRTGDRGCFNQSFNACGCVNSKEYDCALFLGVLAVLSPNGINFSGYRPMLKVCEEL